MKKILAKTNIIHPLRMKALDDSLVKPMNLLQLTKCLYFVKPVKLLKLKLKLTNN